MRNTICIYGERTGPHEHHSPPRRCTSASSSSLAAVPSCAATPRRERSDHPRLRPPHQVLQQRRMSRRGDGADAHALRAPQQSRSAAASLCERRGSMESDERCEKRAGIANQKRLALTHVDYQGRPPRSPSACARSSKRRAARRVVRCNQNAPSVVSTKDDSRECAAPSTVTPLVLSTTSRDVESARRDTFKRVRDDRNIIAKQVSCDIPI